MLPQSLLFLSDHGNSAKAIARIGCCAVASLLRGAAAVKAAAGCIKLEYLRYLDRRAEADRKSVV
jgi:hypothetical protein